MKETSRFLKSLGIVRPTVMLSADQVRRNIQKMAHKAQASQVRFRPHFKTHQSAEIGTWFREAGVQAITVSSLDMAHYFVHEGGWTDITVAIVSNVLELPAINALAERAKLNLLVDSVQTVAALAEGLSRATDIWVKVDVGNRRTGVAWEQTEQVVELVRAIEAAPRLRFAGILTHSGQSYGASSVAGIEAVYGETVARLSAVKAALAARGVEPCLISIGDTPTCSLVPAFDGVDEVRPGVFCFYDLMQQRLGTCRDDEIAVAVACPVIGVYPERKQVVVYGGAVHLSKDALPGPDGRPIFGYVAIWKEGRLVINRDAAVVGLSQEHGILQVNEAFLARVDLADLLLIVPVHACLTCDLYASYTTFDGHQIAKLWR